MNKIPSKILLTALFWLLAGMTLFAQLSVYGPIPGFSDYDSARYSIRVREVNASGGAVNGYTSSHAYYLQSPENNMSHSHWTTFSYSPSGTSVKAEVEVTFAAGNISSYEFRPTHVSNISTSGNKITFRIESNKYTSLIINGDIRNPLFLFCDPAESDVPNPSSPDVFFVAAGSTGKNNPLTIRQIGNKKIIYFEKGEHWINESDSHGYTPQNGNQAFFITDNTGARLEGNQIAQIYIPGGAIVHGNIRATRVTGLTVNGRGIIEGEDTYGYSSGDYYSSQILSSAVNMAAYKDQGTFQPENMNQKLDGITSILPRKYNFQLGSGAVVKNTKCFAYHQTTDGIGVEKNSICDTNFMKVNDDALKLYQDNTVFKNSYIWHQMNGAVMQIGWDKEEGDDILVDNTYLLHDDMYQAGFFNEGFWANQSVICWLKHFAGDRRDNIVIDGINDNNMPLIDVIRVLAIAMDGKMGGSGAGSIDITLKNVILGRENAETPSYVGAASGYTSKASFINAKRNGVCMNSTNVPKRGNTAGVSVLPASGCGSTGPTPVPTPTPIPTVPPSPTPTPGPTPTPVTGLKGDVNNDGQINIVDALMTSQYYVGLNPPGFNRSLADTNCSGSIDIVDALRIAQYYVGLIAGFC